MSPDGSRVAFNNRGGSLVVAAADGSGARELIQAWVDDIVWSPTGDRIAFSYGTTSMGYATELRVIDLASGVVTPLAGMGGADSLRALEFSPDGDRILFSRADRLYEEISLWTVNADGSGLRRLVSGTTWGDWQAIRPTR